MVILSWLQCIHVAINFAELSVYLQSKKQYSFAYQVRLNEMHEPNTLFIIFVNRFQYIHF